MIGIYEMNPDNYLERVFTGETLEQFLEEKKSYKWQEVFGLEDEEVESFIDDRIKDAKNVYKEGSTDYVCTSGNYCEICFIEYEEAWRHEFEQCIAGNYLSIFDISEIRESFEHYYGEDRITELNALEEDEVDEIEESNAEILYREDYQICTDFGIENRSKVIVLDYEK